MHSGIIVTRPSEPELLAVRLKRFFDEMYPNIAAPFCVAPSAHGEVAEQGLCEIDGLRLLGGKP